MGAFDLVYPERSRSVGLKHLQGKHDQAAHGGGGPSGPDNFSKQSVGELETQYRKLKDLSRRMPKESDSAKRLLAKIDAELDSRPRSGSLVAAGQRSGIKYELRNNKGRHFIAQRGEGSGQAWDEKSYSGYEKLGGRNAAYSAFEQLTGKKL